MQRIKQRKKTILLRGQPRTATTCIISMYKENNSVQKYFDAHYI
jgi:hypothetical protein